MATRYDKLKDRYLATVTIASIMVWLRGARNATANLMIRQMRPSVFLPAAISDPERMTFEING
ncbi:hypothetical protein [Phytohabitans aurantiacus]|uniref:Uncharacterized protein n=1 Tax=Phytohabitans aurantiacus TaxID=3016789 RepID=A0ABQ5R9U4_9ACTN|nr:hypothetical protein [Phytohabitans aurantiacus]GLI03371.1 hypothetical protein Pa4123_86490 [Phytohabitans aurantiacus]